MRYPTNGRTKATGRYKKSLLAYLDIIGFKELVHQSEKSADEADAIYQLLQVYYRSTRIINEGKALPPGSISGLKATAFSDNIVLSLTGMTDEKFNSFVHAVTCFQWNTVDFCSFLRGAIVFGDNCQTREMIFGPALVRAYEMERSVARWPRVLVDPQLIRLLSPRNRSLVFKTMLSIGADGLPFVDYLRYMFLYRMAHEAEDPPWGPPASFVFRQNTAAIRSALKPGLDISVVSGFHILSTYHNDCIDRLCREFQNGIRFPGVDEKTMKYYAPILPKEKVDLADLFGQCHVPMKARKR